MPHHGKPRQMEVTFSIRDAFFDRPAVVSAIDKGRRRALSRAGAFIRRKVRTRILRRRKRPSAPGEPPSIHSDGALGLKSILFGYDQATDSVVVGPIRLNQVVQSAIDLGAIRIPTLLEFGGPAIIHEESLANGRPWATGEIWRRRNMRSNPREWKRYRTRRTMYAPRPFMGPGLEQTLPELPTAFANLLASEGALLSAA